MVPARDVGSPVATEQLGTRGNKGMRREPTPSGHSVLAGDLSVTSPAPRDVWLRVSRSDPHALVTQTPEWTDAMVEAVGWIDVSRWYVTPDGRDLVLPMVQRRLGGSLGLRSSFADAHGTGGLLAPGGVTSSDVEMVLADLERQPALRTAIRINPLLAGPWGEATPPPGLIVRPRHAHVLDLNGGADVVWNTKMTSKARGGVRRARKLGVEVECDTTGELIPVFYELLLQSFDRWAARQHEPAWLTRVRGKRRDPLRKFEIMADRLGGAFRLYVARHQGRPAAAVMVLSEANAYVTRGAMDAAIGGRTKANDLLHWTAIEDACRSGCRAYHMGVSAPESSLARFKEKFGARLVPYGDYIIERLPITRADAALRRLTKRVIGFRDV